MNLQTATLPSLRVYMVGIKGTGMAALAELLTNAGAHVRGSDVDEVFFTDEILKKNGIPYFFGFDANQVPEDIDIAIHSAAFDPETHPELQVIRQRNIPLQEYTQALGDYCRRMMLGAVSGIHGKTSTTAMAGTIIQECGVPASVLVGSAVRNFGGSPTLDQGHAFMVAETCEYRRHFLNFDPGVLIVTSIEADHLDYFADEADIFLAFEQMTDKLPAGGALIYCADDPGAKAHGERTAARRNDILCIPYGFDADPELGIQLSEHRYGSGSHQCRLAGTPDGGASKVDLVLTLDYPGTHSLRNASAAYLMVRQLAAINGQPRTDGELVAALKKFHGTARRSEIVGDEQNILVLDDYAHHPAAIETTLAGYREFYPGRRLVVDFMAHTYSRTTALLEDFAGCFGSADFLILNDIYASAREKNPGGMTGEILFDKVAARHDNVRYVPEVSEVAAVAVDMLEPGDIFITMGAGNNWTAGRDLLDLLAQRRQGETS